MLTGMSGLIAIHRLSVGHLYRVCKHSDAYSRVPYTHIVH